MSVTINDVAKHAGVSMKTVSRVINNEPSVREATQEKVMASVKALNYKPNNSARSLAGTRSYTIGFIYDNPNAYYVIDMQNGILSECKDRNYELLIHPCNHKSDKLEEELHSLIEHSRIAGVVLTPPFSEMPNVGKMFEQMQLPYVRVISANDKKKQSSSCIFVNDYEAAYDITQHLISLGHTKIGFLCGGKEHNSSTERLQGFQSALKDSGLKTNAKFVIDGEYSFESGVLGAQKLLKNKYRPTAIFASNDEMAAGALFAARLGGFSIPGDISIVGFEDSPFSRQTWPKLTTAHQPNQLIAQQAAQLLIARIQRQAECETEETAIKNFRPELVIRDSTGPVPACE
ncbi:LacI family DNA-binding transcriptional regulator [Aliikangiella sp. IMCC44359]|uniref:LacI family DNA-binding transcriptional regulator n=1 Tax=Aliikangiella sp. IMCC44359 TaxID=3459125 RepID=UPI00403A7D30